MKHPCEECRVRRELPSELRCCQHRAGCLRRWQLRSESGDRPAVQRFGEQMQTILTGWKPGTTPSDSSRCIPQCLPDSIAQPIVTNRFACGLVTLKTGRTRRAWDTLAPCRGPGYRDHSSGVPTSLLLAEIDRPNPWRYPQRRWLATFVPRRCGTVTDCEPEHPTLSCSSIVGWDRVACLAREAGVILPG